MNTFSYIATSVMLLGIFGQIYPNIAVASSSERTCEKAAKQRLQETNFGSRLANDSKKLILPFALPTVMNIIKLSNQGKLNSPEDRFNAVRNELQDQKINWLVKDPDKVSHEATRQIESLLESECEGIR